MFFFVGCGRTSLSTSCLSTLAPSVIALDVKRRLLIGHASKAKRRRMSPTRPALGTALTIWRLDNRRMFLWRRRRERHNSSSPDDNLNKTTLDSAGRGMWSCAQCLIYLVSMTRSESVAACDMPLDAIIKTVDFLSIRFRWTHCAGPRLNLKSIHSLF